MIGFLYNLRSGYDFDILDKQFRFFHLIEKGISVGEWLIRSEHLFNSINNLVYAPNGIADIINGLASNLLIYLDCHVDSIKFCDDLWTPYPQTN